MVTVSAFVPVPTITDCPTAPAASGKKTVPFGPGTWPMSTVSVWVVVADAVPMSTVRVGLKLP